MDEIVDEGIPPRHRALLFILLECRALFQTDSSLKEIFKQKQLDLCPPSNQPLEGSVLFL